jgi:hypothetical protein
MKTILKKFIGIFNQCHINCNDIFQPEKNMNENKNLVNKCKDDVLSIIFDYDKLPFDNVAIAQWLVEYGRNKGMLVVHVSQVENDKLVIQDETYSLLSNVRGIMVALSEAVRSKTPVEIITTLPDNFTFLSSTLSSSSSSSTNGMSINGFNLGEFIDSSSSIYTQQQPNDERVNNFRGPSISLSIAAQQQQQQQQQNRFSTLFPISNNNHSDITYANNTSETNNMSHRLHMNDKKLTPRRVAAYCVPNKSVTTGHKSDYACFIFLRPLIDDISIDNNDNNVQYSNRNNNRTTVTSFPPSPSPLSIYGNNINPTVQQPTSVSLSMTTSTTTVNSSTSSEPNSNVLTNCNSFSETDRDLIRCVCSLAGSALVRHKNKYGFENYKKLEVMMEQEKIANTKVYNAIIKTEALWKKGCVTKSDIASALESGKLL